VVARDEMGSQGGLSGLGSAASTGLTRVVIVKDDGVVEYWAESWRVSIQDGGRTLKLFAHGDGGPGLESRSAELAADLRKIAGRMDVRPGRVGESGRQPAE